MHCHHHSAFEERYCISHKKQAHDKVLAVHFDDAVLRSRQRFASMHDLERNSHKRFLWTVCYKPNKVRRIRSDRLWMHDDDDVVESFDTATDRVRLDDRTRETFHDTKP